jgi:FkbM family methyltransferase
MTQTLERAGLTFVCTDPIEVWRAETLLEKEPGTVAWIETFLPGDVFYDIGANIGVYSLLAAKRGCDVWAFDPHPANCVALKANADASGLSDRIRVEQIAMSSLACEIDLHIRSPRAGSSGSQVGHPRDERGAAFTPDTTTAITSWTVDEFAAYGLIPTHIKIDVDGHELAILYGARDTLASGVRSVQVETHPAQRSALLHYMQAMGYGVQTVHYTQQGIKAIAKGANPATVVSNTIFVPEGA